MGWKLDVYSERLYNIRIYRLVLIIDRVSYSSSLMFSSLSGLNCLTDSLRTRKMSQVAWDVGFLSLIVLRTYISFIV